MPDTWRAPHMRDAYPVRGHWMMLRRRAEQMMFDGDDGMVRDSYNALARVYGDDEADRILNGRINRLARSLDTSPAEDVSSSVSIREHRLAEARAGAVEDAMAWRRRNGIDQ